MLGLILIAIIICLLIDRSDAKKYRRNDRPKNPQPPASEWKWDEEKQLWVHPQSVDAQPNTAQHSPEIGADGIDYSKAYQAKYLFTKNEWYQHKKLKEIADVKGYVVCPKVRLWDIIEPKRGEKKYKTLQYKIQSKHVDFLICDKDMHIKAIIELDDNSHNQKDRKERDEFVDLILHSVGYKVIHTRYITPDILDTI